MIRKQPCGYKRSNNDKSRTSKNYCSNKQKNDKNNSNTLSNNNK